MQQTKVCIDSSFETPLGRRSPTLQEHGPLAQLSGCHKLCENLCKRNQFTHVLQHLQTKTINVRVEKIASHGHLCKPTKQNKHCFIQFEMGFFGKGKSTCRMNHRSHREMIKASVPLQVLSCSSKASSPGCCIHEHLQTLQVHLIELLKSEKISSKLANQTTSTQTPKP